MSKCNICGKFFKKEKSMTNHRRWCDKSFSDFQNKFKSQMREQYFNNELKLTFSGRQHTTETKKKFKNSFTKERRLILSDKAKNNKNFSFKGYTHTKEVRNIISKTNKIEQLGEKNSMWKGDDVGYGSLHEWIKTYKPKSKLCECCGKKSPFDLANISQTYKRDIDDYEWLCRRCHMSKDGRLQKMQEVGGLRFNKILGRTT